MANWLPPASFQFVQIALEKAPLGKKSIKSTYISYKDSHLPFSVN